MKKKIFFILFLPLLTACLDEPDCVREASNVVKVAFRNISNGERLNVDINKVTISGTDSVFFPMVSANGLPIPINFLKNSSTVVFETSERVDTLIFSYNTVTRLISPECGPETFITGLTVKEHTFDSLKTVNLILSPDVPVNYEIFY
jgi:hypothetical protein